MYQPIRGTVRCPTCRNEMRREVLCTPAGYYVGRYCNHCGPYSRESGYFSEREHAEQELKYIEEYFK